MTKWRSKRVTCKALLHIQFASQSPVFTRVLRFFKIEAWKKFGVNQLTAPINTEKVWRKMIVKGKYKYEYSTVNLKISVAKRFRLFSKKIAKSHSESLGVIMDFFEWHGFLPSDKFEKSVIHEIVKNRKRTEASIAIIKSIEKDQTKPTNTMLLSLFEENLTQDAAPAPEMVEKKFADKTVEKNIIEDTSLSKIQYDRLTDKMNLIKQDFTYVLDQVKMVKGNFGKSYLKLELTQQELVKLKNTLKNR